MKRPLIRVLKAKRTPSPVVASITLGLVACLIFAGYLCVVAFYHDLYSSVYIRWPKPEIVYVAADAMTGKLLCKIYNAGNGRATIETIYINATQINPRAPLPVIIPYGEYATAVLPYDGPWNGQIQIIFGLPYYNYSHGVDLNAVSTNPVGDAYPTPLELLAVYLHQHAWEIAFAIVVSLLLTVVAGALVLRKRGRVSLLAFFSTILGFWIYYFILAFIFYHVTPSPSQFVFFLFLTLCSSGLSFFTIYGLLTPKPRRQSSHQLSE